MVAASGGMVLASCYKPALAEDTIELPGLDWT